MMVDIINKFRRKNGKDNILCWNPVENDYCLQHCMHMSRTRKLEHASDYLRSGKAEAVASCVFLDDMENTIKHLIYGCIGNSSEHRKVILDYDNLSYGFMLHDYVAYITIRGW